MADADATLTRLDAGVLRVPAGETVTVEAGDRNRYSTRIIHEDGGTLKQEAGSTVQAVGRTEVGDKYDAVIQ